MKTKTPSISYKMRRLREILKETGGAVIAFSGGVDRTFLAAVAQEVLGARALAVTALSPTYPQREQKEAAELAARIGIRHETVESNELEIPNFADNPSNRCYFCKGELFRILRRIADRNGLPAVADGSNADDTGDYRPGRQAAREIGVKSPLLEASLTKDDIRRLSRKMGLPTADKPSFACLASRFPYGNRITPERLTAVDTVEEGLRGMGFRQVRVRHHGTIARIEVEPQAIRRFLSPDVREKVLQLAKGAGFLYVTLDLQGYRTGSMNEALSAEARAQHTPAAAGRRTAATAPAGAPRRGK